ncbi:MAG TPA: acyltransferase [Edaphobacter sp.]|nr:acyltransferase [Edaphobacter sp.]
MGTATISKPHTLPHLRELDGMRGIAALIVFFHHLCSASIYTNNWGPGVLFLRNLFEYGTSGVDVFFVLSGFLITSLLIRDRQSPAYYRDFYWKRALRILPLYVLCLFGVLLLIPHSTGYVLVSALFIANFANAFHIQSAGPFWSLAIEEQFYLLWPTVVRRRSVSTLGHWALAIAVTAVLLRFASAIVGHHNYYITFLRCDGLAVGALIACRFERRQREHLRLSADDSLFVAALVIGALLCTVPFALPSTTVGIAFAEAFRQTGITLICGGIVGLLIAHTESKGLAPLRSRFLTFFGLISYALYMIHLYVMGAYDHIRGPLPIGDTRAYATRILVVFAITIVASLLSRYLVELPALSLRKHVLKKTAPEAETEAPIFTR